MSKLYRFVRSYEEIFPVHTPGNRVGVKSVSRVRIPPSPPEPRKRLVSGAFPLRLPWKPRFAFRAVAQTTLIPRSSEENPGSAVRRPGKTASFAAHIMDRAPPPRFASRLGGARRAERNDSRPSAGRCAQGAARGAEAQVPRKQVSGPARRLARMPGASRPGRKPPRSRQLARPPRIPRPAPGRNPAPSLETAYHRPERGKAYFRNQPAAESLFPPSL